MTDSRLYDQPQVHRKRAEAVMLAWPAGVSF
jgi:hypothetical protein